MREQAVCSKHIIMNNFKIYLSILFLGFGLLTFFSCSDELNPEEASLDNNLELRLKNRTRMPSFKVKNGILYFETKNDANTMIDMIRTRESKIENPTFEDFVDIESSLGIKTLYVSEYTKGIRNIEEEYTSEEIRYLLESDYINDPIQKLILNEHYQVGIGDDVIIPFGPDIHLTILESDPQTLKAFQETPKGGDVIPSDLINEHVIADNNNHVINHDTSNSNNTDVDPRSSDYTLSAWSTPVPCSPLEIDLSAKVEREWFDENGFHTENVDASFTIEWGDGTVSTASSALGLPILERHEYPSLGEYKIKVTAVYTDDEGDTQTATTFVDIDLNEDCSSADTFESGELETPNGKYKMSYKLWFNNGYFAHSWIGGYTHSWRWKASKSKWVRDRAELDVDFTAVWLNGDCTLDDDKIGQDDCNNCKKVQDLKSIFMNQNRRIKEGDITSQHRAKFDDGQILSIALVLDPCG